MDMHRKIIAALGLSLLLSSAAFSTPAAPGPSSDGMPSYEDFSRRVEAFPYRAPDERRAQIVSGTAALTQCMKKEEVVASLGKPDFSQPSYGPKGPHMKWLGFSWTYYLAKSSTTTNLNDPSLQLFFDTAGLLVWAVPHGIENAKEIGKFNAKCS